MERQNISIEAYKTIRFAFPIIIGELTQFSLGIIDAAMVGKIDYRQLAAASLVNNILTVPFIMSVGVTIGVSQCVAFAAGEGDPRKVAHYMYNGGYLAAIFAGSWSLIIILCRSLLHRLSQEDQVVFLATPYLIPMACSLIPMILFLTLKQFADSLGKTRIAMTLSLAGIPVNFLLNYIFIYGHWGAPRLELPGAGLATLITRTLLFLSLWLAIFFDPFFRPYTRWKERQWKISSKAISDLLFIGIPSSCQLAIELSAMAVAGVLVGSIGSIQQAAHQIAVNCSNAVLMVVLGFAQGTFIRISYARGRREWKAIAEIAKSSLLITVVFGIVCGICFVMLRNHLPMIFTQDKGVRLLSARLLLVAAIFQFSNAFQVMSAVRLRSIQDLKHPLLYSILSYWIIGLPAGYYLAFRAGMGIYGIWCSFIAGMTFSGVALHYRFRKLIHPMISQKVTIGTADR